MSLATEVFHIPPSELEQRLPYIDFVELMEFYKLRAEKDKKQTRTPKEQLDDFLANGQRPLEE